MENLLYVLPTLVMGAIYSAPFIRMTRCGSIMHYNSDFSSISMLCPYLLIPDILFFPNIYVSIYFIIMLETIPS